MACWPPPLLPWPHVWRYGIKARSIPAEVLQCLDFLAILGDFLAFWVNMVRREDSKLLAITLTPHTQQKQNQKKHEKKTQTHQTHQTHSNTLSCLHLSSVSLPSHLTLFASSQTCLICLCHPLSYAELPTISWNSLLAILCSKLLCTSAS